MLRKLFAALAAVGVLCIPSGYSAQQKGGKADEQAKMVTVQFAKAFLMTKDVDAVMKLTAVPFFSGFGEDQKVIRKLDDLKRQFATTWDNKRFEPFKGILEIRDTRTYEQFPAKAGDKVEGIHAKLLGDAIPKMLDKVLNKTDRVLTMRGKSDEGIIPHLVVMVGWRDGQAKVVGYGIAWQKLPPKAK